MFKFKEKLSCKNKQLGYEVENLMPLKFYREKSIKKMTNKVNTQKSQDSFANFQM